MAIATTLARADSALAAAGDLDTGFGNGGKVLTDLGGMDDSASSVATYKDPSGRILVVGRTYLDGQFAVAFVRYLPNGSLDPTFGTNGKAIHSGILRSDLDRVEDLAIQPDGKILVVAKGAILRFQADGRAVDTTFGSGGQVTFSNFTPSDIVLQPADGKVLVAGTGLVAGGSGGRFGLARLLPTDGARDASFGVNGLVVKTEPFAQLSHAVVLPDRRIAAFGSQNISTGVTSRFHMAALRFLENGSDDTSFSEDGKDLAVLGTSDRPEGLIAQSDGKLVAAVSVENPPAPGSFARSLAFLRWNSDGTKDGTFGTGGVVRRTTMPGDASMVGLSGNRFAVGSRASGTWYVGRYEPDGVPDAAFGERTTIVRPNAQGASNLTGIAATQLDEDIVAFGDLQTTATYDFLLARYDSGTVNQSPPLEAPPVVPPCTFNTCPTPPPPANCPDATPSTVRDRAYQTTCLEVTRGTPPEPGVLAIGVERASVDFGDVADGSARSAVAIGEIYYTNTLSGSQPWNASVAATSMVGANRSVPFTAMTYSPGPQITPSGAFTIGTSRAFSGPDADPGVSYSSQVPLTTAAAGTRGEFTHSGSTIAVAVPTGTAPGGYRGTLQYSIFAG